MSPILISLGANDVLDRVVGVCGLDLACAAAVLPGVLAEIAANYDEILGRLRAAAHDATIVVLTPYNPLAVIDPATNALAVVVNATIASVATAHRARVADAFPAFNLGPQPATLCALTLMCTPLVDIHASGAGYAVIADLMFEAGATWSSSTESVGPDGDRTVERQDVGRLCSFSAHLPAPVGFRARRRPVRRPPGEVRRRR